MSTEDQTDSLKWLALSGKGPSHWTSSGILGSYSALIWTLTSQTTASVTLPGALTSTRMATLTSMNSWRPSALWSSPARGVMSQVAHKSQTVVTVAAAAQVHTKARCTLRPALSPSSKVPPKQCRARCWNVFLISVNSWNFMLRICLPICNRITCVFRWILPKNFYQSFSNFSKRLKREHS